MQDKGSTLSNYLSVVNSLEVIKNEVITFNPKENDRYQELISNYENSPNNNLKGKVFEELVEFIVRSVPIFKTYKNIRTATNEIDILI